MAGYQNNGKKGYCGAGDDISKIAFFLPKTRVKASKKIILILRTGILSAKLYN